MPGGAEQCDLLALLLALALKSHCLQEQDARI
jgi:hypothetical protein